VGEETKVSESEEEESVTVATVVLEGKKVEVDGSGEGEEMEAGAGVGTEQETERFGPVKVCEREMERFRQARISGEIFWDCWQRNLDFLTGSYSQKEALLVEEEGREETMSAEATAPSCWSPERGEESEGGERGGEESSWISARGASLRFSFALRFLNQKWMEWMGRWRSSANMERTVSSGLGQSW
jgi:hypothetical protein